MAPAAEATDPAGHPRAADPAYLSGVLGRAGLLGDGSIRRVEIASDRATLLSRIVRLRLHCDNLPPTAPATLILKSALPQSAGSNWNAGQREVEFYTRVAPATTTPVLPRCFDAVWTEETGAWHLLLEDLTDSHSIATQWPLPPNEQQCGQIIEALARFHASWWDDSRLGVTVGTWPDHLKIETYVRDLGRHLTSFVDRLGDSLSPERRGLCEAVLAAAPRLLQRVSARRNVTIGHGDAHVWNVMLPRGSGDPRWFDWDGWGLNVASNDLAYMMAVHWYPDRRRRLEATLLDRYHRALLGHGVQGYDRLTLQNDYRRSTLLKVLVPIWQAGHGIPPVVWWGHLERIAQAVDDLDCRALLG